VMRGCSLKMIGSEGTEEKPELRPRHVLVLLKLAKHGTLIFSDIRRIIKDYEYTVATIEELKMLGYIEEERVGEKKRVRVFRLTDEGRKIVREMLKGL